MLMKFPVFVDFRFVRFVRLLSILWLALIVVLIDLSFEFAVFEILAVNDSEHLIESQSSEKGASHIGEDEYNWRNWDKNTLNPLDKMS